MKKVNFAESDPRKIIRHVLFHFTNKADSTELLKYFLKQYQIFDITDLFNSLKDDMSKESQTALKQIVLNSHAKYERIHKARVGLISADDELNKYAHDVEQCEFISKQEKFDFGIKSWSFINNKSIKDYAKLLVFVCLPTDFDDTVSLREFFELVSYLKQYHEFEDDLFEKLILLFSEELCDIICDNDLCNVTPLFEFFPFTNSNVAKLISHLTGQVYTMSQDGAIKLYDVTPNPCFEIFCDRIINAVIPGKFNIQSMMIEQWIRNSPKQLLNYFGPTDTKYVLQNLNSFIQQYEPQWLFDFEFDDNYCGCSHLAEAIKDNAPLFPDILTDLNNYFFVVGRYDGVVKDNISIGSFNASLLQRGIKDISVQWDNVEFFNSHIVIKHNANGMNVEFKHKCKSSTKIANALQQEDSACSLALSVLPLIHCATVDDKIIRILNEEQVDQCVADLRGFANRPQVVPSHNTTNDDACAFLLSLKSDCLKYLIDNRATKYPVISIKEKFITNSGINTLEDAAIFVISESNDKLVLVYENSLISHSSYVFTIKKSSLDTAQNAIKKYFTSDIINKRQRLIYDTSAFNKESGFLSIKRVSHTDLDIWKKDILNK